MQNLKEPLNSRFLKQIIGVSQMHREVKESEENHSKFRSIYLHANWRDFITLCESLGFGEIENLKIQDGLPMFAEIVKKKINFSKRKKSSS